MAFGNDGLHVEEYVYDFAEDGGAVSAIDLSAKVNHDLLPANATAVMAHVEVLTTLASGGAATIATGSTDDDNKYSGEAAVGFATLNASGGTKYDISAGYYLSAANKQDMLLTIAGAALTAGKIRVSVAYFLGGRTE